MKYYTYRYTKFCQMQKRYFRGGNDGIVELSAGNAGSAGISSVGLSLNRHVWHTAIPFSSLVVVKICRPLMDSNDESKLPFNS